MALVTAAQARVHIPSLTSTGEDTNIDTLIARVGALFGRWCGYPPTSAGGASSMESSASHILYNGLGGYVDVISPRFLRSKVWPVTAISSIYDDVTEAYATAITSTNYAIVDGNAGLIGYTASSGAAWLKPSSPSVRNIKATLTCGWSTVPTDVQEAAVLMLHHWWELRHTQGRQNVATAAGTSAGLREETMPAAVRQLLAPYRLPHVWL